MYHHFFVINDATTLLSLQTTDLSSDDEYVYWKRNLLYFGLLLNYYWDMYESLEQLERPTKCTPSE